MTEIPQRFARVAEAFAARVAAVPEAAWDNTSPCEGWVGGVVVPHLAEWLPPPVAWG